MKEKAPPVLDKEHRPLFSEEDILRARDGFEHLAKRLDQLWSKKDLTDAEEREVELIVNNAMVLQDVIDGKTPEEFLAEH